MIERWLYIYFLQTMGSISNLILTCIIFYKSEINQLGVIDHLAFSLTIRNKPEYETLWKAITEVLWQFPYEHGKNHRIPVHFTNLLQLNY